MHYTLTLNPALDYFMNFKNKLLNHQKTDDFKIIPGGKGINASLLLNNLNIQNTSISLLGGIFGKKFEELIQEYGIKHIGVDTKVETRINVKANFDDTYEMNASGEEVNFKDIELNLKLIIDKMTSEDTLLIMGSLPNGMEFKNLEKIVQWAKDRKVKLVFDLSKDHLSKLVKYNPEIIKPNKKELEELFECKINTKDEAFDYAEKLISLGAKRVLVSFDKSGSIYTDNQNNQFIINGLEIEEVNGSGAGDSMISAFIAGLNSKLSIEETLKLASGAGTGTASVIGIADIQTIKKYKDQILVNERKQNVNTK